MARFTLTIDTGNAAFDEDAGGEVARILTGVAHMVDGHGLRVGDGDRYLADVNGNKVGTWSCRDDSKPAWSLHPGRWLHHDDVPTFALQRGERVSPADVDKLAHRVCDLLNGSEG